MRTRALLAAVVVAAWAATQSTAGAAERPSFASINVCTDQLLLSIADDAQILGLSPYARDPARSWSAAEARRFPRLSGEAEDVLILRPDIVLAAQFTKRSTRELLKEQGFRVVEFDTVTSVQDVKDQVAEVGRLAGHPDRAAQIVARIDAALARARTLTARERFRVLAVSRRGWISGRDSLTSSLLEAVGLANAASEIGIRSGGFAALEAIIQARPDFLVLSEDSPVAEDQGQAFLLHPALERLYPAAKRLVIPERLTVCGGAMLADAIDRLGAELARVSR